MAKTKAETAKAWVEKNPGYHADYRAKNIEKRRQWNRDWIAANRDRYNASKHIYRDKLKETVLAHYGNGKAECVVCGFSDIDCLVLDHVDDDGAAHRKALNVSCRGDGGGHRIYERLSALGMPDDVRLQTLCANCNTKKQVAGKRLVRLENPVYAERHRKEMTQKDADHSAAI